GAARAPFAVRTCSALEGSGVLDVADELLHMARAQATPEKRGEKRQELFRRALERQAVASLWRQLDAWEEFPDLLTALKRSELTLRQAIERVTASGKVSTRTAQGSRVCNPRFSSRPRLKARTNETFGPNVTNAPRFGVKSY